MSIDNIKLVRLLTGLELAGVPKRGMNRIVSEKTGYSLSMVARVLTQNVPLTSRFISSVCSAFSISTVFVESGFGEWHSDDFGKNAVSDDAAQLIELLNDKVEFKEALKELQQMSEARRWEAVGMLKRMNNEESK